MFDNMVKQLEVQTLSKTHNLKITQQEFDDFCKEYIFEQLKGISLGYAFCEKYNESNFVLSILPNESAKKHIKKFYIK
jgi:hypothetical protein